MYHKKLWDCGFASVHTSGGCGGGACGENVLASSDVPRIVLTLGARVHLLLAFFCATLMVTPFAWSLLNGCSDQQSSCAPCKSLWCNSWLCLTFLSISFPFHLPFFPFYERRSSGWWEVAQTCFWKHHLPVLLLFPCPKMLQLSPSLRNGAKGSLGAWAPFLF